MSSFQRKVDQFADIGILRYKVYYFEKLSLREKLFIYYLSHAALAGRDIAWDQNCRYNLLIRNVLETIVLQYSGDRDCADFQLLLTYIKRVWTFNGIHHVYSRDKIFPSCDQTYFVSVLFSLADILSSFDASFATIDDFISFIVDIIYNPSIAAKQVVTDTTCDVVASSATNYYHNVTQQEVEEYYAHLEKTNISDRPVSLGLNSQVVQYDGRVQELVWKVGGKYHTEISHIVYRLEKATEYAASPHQAHVLQLLIRFYFSGDLADRDAYCLAWLQDTTSRVDVCNGFIEVYADPLQRKGGREATVKFVDMEANHRSEILLSQTQWFEDHAPIDDRFKKEKVIGVHANVMTVAMLGGDCFPITYLGQNLPNQHWIRAAYGSKSVTHENIGEAYAQAEIDSGYWDEFLYSAEEKNRAKMYGYLAGGLHTDMHECLGHGSGKLLPGITTHSLGIYHSTIEEARADLFALYYLMDEKMIDLGLVPSLDVAKAKYTAYIFNGLMGQLRRVSLGQTLQQTHMRNRQLIAAWCYAQGNAEHVIEKKVSDGKTYISIRDFVALRILFAKLLAEIQRITSEGDTHAARTLIETYAVSVDTSLHTEMLERFAALGCPPYYGFVNPEYSLVEKNGEIVDVTLSYPESFVAQMMQYSRFSEISKFS